MASRGIDPTIAHEALALVNGQRQEVYGSPEDNMGRTAALWSAYLETPVSPRDVAICMALVKLARLRNRAHRDGWVDLVGYALVAEACQ